MLFLLIKGQHQRSDEILVQKQKVLKFLLFLLRLPNSFRLLHYRKKLNNSAGLSYKSKELSIKIGKKLPTIRFTGKHPHHVTSLLQHVPKHVLHSLNCAIVLKSFLSHTHYSTKIYLSLHNHIFYTLHNAHKFFYD